MFNHMYMIIVDLPRTFSGHLYQTDFVFNWLVFVSKSVMWYSLIRYIMMIALADPPSTFNNENPKKLFVWIILTLLSLQNNKQWHCRLVQNFMTTYWKGRVQKVTCNEEGRCSKPMLLYKVIVRAKAI